MCRDEGCRHLLWRGGMRKGAGLTTLRQRLEILGCAEGPLKLMRPQGFLSVHLFLSNNVSNTGLVRTGSQHYSYSSIFPPCHHYLQKKGNSNDALHPKKTVNPKKEKILWLFDLSLFTLKKIAGENKKKQAKKKRRKATITEKKMPQCPH